MLWILALIWAVTSYGAMPPSPAPSASPPAIQGLLKAEVYQRATQEREVMANAKLEDVPEKPPLRRYSYYSTMLVNATETETRKVLTNYPLYAKMISYIDRAEYDPATQTLALEGGIWKFRLISKVRFEEVTSRWIRYRIVQGHFTGLTGDIFFEPWKSDRKQGTLVYMRGETTGDHFPPAFVLERGAEIVFGFTGRRMRSYIEAAGGAPQNEPHNDNIPKPRSHL